MRPKIGRYESTKHAGLWKALEAMPAGHRLVVVGDDRHQNVIRMLALKRYPKGTIATARKHGALYLRKVQA